MKQSIKIITILLALLFTLSACSEKEDDSFVPVTELTISPDFNWQTSSQVEVEVSLLTNNSAPVSGVVFEIFSSEPSALSTPLAKGITLSDGKYQSFLNLPNALKKIWIRGYMGVHEVVINNNRAVLNLGGAMPKSAFSGDFEAPNSKAWSFLPGFTFNSQGRPSPMTNVPLEADFISRLNSTLPESSPLPTTHPQYMNTSNQVNLKIDQPAEVWLTFVNEGAGYLNSLGFYTYSTGLPPATTSDIDTRTIVMPNASLAGSGGEMQAGDTVYLGLFDPGITMGWFLVANGYKGNGTNVSTTAPVYYSDVHLNPESTPEKKKHSILVYDHTSQRLVVGFEDLPRMSGSDDDFNDLVFFLTVNPIEAADIDGIPPMDNPEDTDGDGVSDDYDDYPTDPELAFNNYTFGPGNWGSLVFEDLWPDRGDYDFNDMVVDYNYNQITQPGNRVKKVEMNFKLRAIGARKANGFAVQTPFASSNITMLTASHPALFEHETDGSTAVMRFFNSTYDLIPQVPNSFINTEQSMPYYEPAVFSVHFRLINPINIINVNPTPPYNPFIFVDGIRSKEVHLPGYPPTSRMDTSLFGTGDDISSEGNWYKTADNLPWAVNIPESWDYPVEKAQISRAYSKFKHWAQSSGASYPDWYKDLPGYRNPNYFYHTP